MRLLIAILLIVLSNWPINLYCQQYANPQYYLVDSLDYEKITDPDKKLVDSCLHVYHSNVHDTIKLSAISKIVESSWDNAVWPKYNLFLYHRASELYSISELPIYKEYLASSLNNIGYLEDDLGNVEKALSAYLQALNYLMELNDTLGQSSALNNIGYTYFKNGNTAMALEYYLKSLKIRELLNDSAGIARSLNNIGGIYDLQTEYDEALYYYAKALNFVHNSHDQQLLAQAYNNLGVLYKKKGKIDSAIVFYHKSLNNMQALNHTSGIARGYHNLSMAYLELGVLDSANQFIEKSLQLREQTNDIKSKTASLLTKCSILLKEGKPHEAKDGLITVVETAVENSYPDLIERSAKMLWSVYKQEGNYIDALKMYELHVQMRDTLTSLENKKATIRQQTKYEFEKAQLVAEQQRNEELRIQNEKLERRNNLQYSIIFIAILGVFGLVMALGKIQVSPKMAEGLIFFAFLILFEFLLVLSDPYVDSITNGEPMYKLLANAILAVLIFPAHAFFESVMKKKFLKQKNNHF